MLSVGFSQNCFTNLVHLDVGERDSPTLQTHSTSCTTYTQTHTLSEATRMEMWKNQHIVTHFIDALLLLLRLLFFPLLLPIFFYHYLYYTFL